MSEENQQQPPIDPTEPSATNDTAHGDRVIAGSQHPLNQPPIQDDPESDESSAQPAAEEEFEIIFYATVNTPSGVEQAASYEQDTPLSEEDVKILLPAWSSSTVTSRAAAAAAAPPPAVLAQSKPSRPRWQGCLMALIAGVIVFSLVGSSMASVFWFLTVRGDRISEVAGMASSSQSRDTDASKPSPVQGTDGRRLPAAAVPRSDVRINRIVFVNGERQLETISPDGSQRQALTSDAKSYSFPVWSPDGQSIAAIGNGLDGAGIYVLPDEEVSELPEAVYDSDSEFPFYLYWSPDSRDISFLASSRMAGLSLNIVDAMGGDDHRTIALGSPVYWDWTADSTQLLTHSGSDDGEAQLVLVDNMGRQQAPQIPSPGLFQTPGISADGRYWAYSQYRAGGTDWVVIEDRLDGSDQSRRHAGAAALSWSPNRNELAFISGENNAISTAWGPLRLMDAATGNIRLLSSDTIVAFFWSPDGNKILTISVPPQDGLGKQYEVNNQKERRLARLNSPAQRSQPVQMPRHTFQINVIDVESGEGLQLLETTLSPVFMTQFLPYFDQYALSHQLWSPDSSSFILPIVSERISDVTIVDARNGRIDPLAEGSMAFWSRQ